MKITYCTSVRVNEPTAPAHHVLNSCKAFTVLGHEVTLVHPRPRICATRWKDSLHREVVLPFPAIRGGWRLYERMAAWTVRCLAKDMRPDLFYFIFNPSLHLSEAIISTTMPNTTVL
jgi:hypothetical protein